MVPRSRPLVALIVSILLAGARAAPESNDSDTSTSDGPRLRGSAQSARRLGYLEPPTLKDQWLEKFVVVPERKLLFCFMEKVGCKQFTTLFRNLRFPDTYKSAEMKDVWKINQAWRWGFQKQDLERILVDPTWHKAVFYREPLERFLSAYKSKCEMHDADGKQHCLQQFGKFPVEFPEAAASLASRAESHSESGMNRHFVPQSRFCGGLGHTLQYYDTVERLERDTSRDKVVELLRQVGVDAHAVPEFERLYPTAGSKTYVHSKHNTGSTEQFLDYYGDVAVRDIQNMVEFYREDYELFNMSVPSF